MPKLSELKSSPGVSDLPEKAKQAFAAALKMEAQDKPDRAEHWLEKAVEYEEAEE